MTVQALYNKLNARLPKELAEPWDNDGLMVCADADAPVRRVLLALDVTETAVDFAIENRFDVLLTHHPLIFRPLSSVTEDSPVGRKVIKLIRAGVSVFSFHTRADRVDGGVNDVLADLLELTEIEPLSEDGMGRVGSLEEPMSLEEFCDLAKKKLDAPILSVADGGNLVQKVAVLGGEGKDYLKAALASGADTYLSGSLGYHTLEDAPELGINLIEGGHYYTEAAVLGFFEELLSLIDPSISVHILPSNNARFM
ncbi:MAG: Nif3-like dinuclear metal center hexameric protein [Clostridia bacterium]|nr:Nif3-like dinuclear metal center hexameric protein [Clostridia bacterium]